MFIGPSKVETIAFVLDLEGGHPISTLFLWFPWLRNVANVCDLFRLMLRTFGERMGLARVNGYLGAAEFLHAQEIRWLLARFQQECPVDVIDWDPRLRQRWNYNLPRKLSQALASIESYHDDPVEVADARGEVMRIFCQLLLAIGLSPTAP